jgi:hypothetical protein
MDARCLIHVNPVWRERTNYIIGMWILPLQGSTPREWEQLWSRQVADNHFEICCTPLYVYDLALGDEVETGTIMGQPGMIKGVVKRSGHLTLRAWFQDSVQPKAQMEVEEGLNRLGCLLEWGTEDLLGIDATSDEQARVVVELLSEREQMGHLVYETGWS